MLNKIAKRIILLLCTITVVGVLSGCTETILSQNGPTAIFVAGKLDSDNTFSKSVNWLENGSLQKRSERVTIIILSTMLLI